MGKINYCFKKALSSTNNDTIHNLQDLFSSYYKNAQRDLFSSTDSNKIHYILLEESIQYSVIDSLEVCPSENDCDYELPGYETFSKIFSLSRISEKTILPFIPSFPEKNIRLLLLTAPYRKILDEFLELKVSKNDSQNPDKKGHDEEKVAFLNHFLPMQKRHWGNYWNYMSYPIVNSITFDKGLCHAVVNYWNNASGGVSYCRKEKGSEKWKVINTRTLISQ